MCCLKRPFDDQSRPRIAAETGAVVAILMAEEQGSVQLARSPAHVVENDLDPDPERRGAVDRWLRAGPPFEQPSSVFEPGLRAARAAGIRGMDALHLAWAESLNADAFVTVDDELLRRARALASILRCRVESPSAFARSLT
jgi:hypothetical protein